MIDHTEWIENGNTDLEMRLEPHENVDEMEVGTQEIEPGIPTDGTATMETPEEPRLKRLLLAEDLPSSTLKQLSSAAEEDAPPPKSSEPKSGSEDSFYQTNFEFTESDLVSCDAAADAHTLTSVKAYIPREECSEYIKKINHSKYTEAKIDAYNFAYALGKKFSIKKFVDDKYSFWIRRCNRCSGILQIVLTLLKKHDTLETRSNCPWCSGSGTMELVREALELEHPQLLAEYPECITYNEFVRRKQNFE